LSALRAFSLTRRRWGYCLVKLNPRNVRRQGRSTALLALFTTSFSWRLRNRVTLANTRSPARALFTEILLSSA
jgi:hypothetical protein